MSLSLSENRTSFSAPQMEVAEFWMNLRGCSWELRALFEEWEMLKVTLCRLFLMNCC